MEFTIPELKIYEHVIRQIINIEEVYPFGEVNINNIDIEVLLERIYNDEFDRIDGVVVSAWLSEYLGNFREEYTEETKIPCYDSRHYETKSVANKLWDNTWVGYTYWYGGGKHGQPEEVNWIEEAYFLEVKKVMEIVRKFTKI